MLVAQGSMLGPSATRRDGEGPALEVATQAPAGDTPLCLEYGETKAIGGGELVRQSVEGGRGGRPRGWTLRGGERVLKQCPSEEVVCRRDGAGQEGRKEGAR